MTGPWNPADFSAAAGVPKEQLGRYVDDGLLHRRGDTDFAPDSPQRLRLINFARSRGISDEQLAAATAAQGDVIGQYLDFAPPAGMTFTVAQAAAEVGLDQETAAELAEALGWADGIAGTAADVEGLRVLANAQQLGMSREALVQITRVFADATDRLADAVLRTFHNYVHEGFRAEGRAGADLQHATRAIGGPARALLEPALLYFHRRAYANANREHMLRHLLEGAEAPAVGPGAELTTALFVDLASFTTLTATMGDYAAADVVRRFGAAVRSHSGRHGGRILKQIGDAFMLMFDRPRGAVEFGLAMDSFVDTESQFPALHIGAHYGSVLYRDGDYVGTTINLAARAASASSGGQFLITEELHTAVGDFEGADFVATPPRRLKGIADPIRLIEVRCRNPEHANRPSDPVCGVKLHADRVAARTTWQDRPFVFCSAMCHDAFVADPVRFIST